MTTTITREVCLLLSVGLLLTGCEKKNAQIKPPPEPALTANIAYGEEDPSCRCTGARPVSLFNPNGVAVYVEYEIIKKNTSTTPPVMTLHPGNDVISTAGYKLLGCSVGDYGSSPGCVFTYEPRVKKVSRVPPAKLLKMIGGQSEGGLNLEYCKEACAKGIECAHLGADAYKLFAPLKEMLAANSGKDHVIKAADVMKQYGAKEDACERGDIHVSKAGLVTNANAKGEGCSIQAFGNPSLADIELRFGQLRGQLGNGAVHFSDDMLAPQIAFVGTRRDLDPYLGGTVQSAGEYTHPNGQLMGLLQTQNGCIDMPAVTP